MTEEQINSISTVRLGLTMGDPVGIGPEIIVKAAAALVSAKHRFDRHITLVIFGCRRTLDEVAHALGELPAWSDHCEFQDVPWVQVAPERREASASAGRCSFECVEQAIVAAKRAADDPKRIDAIVTAPISKTAWNMAGVLFPGHTELLHDRFNGHSGRAFGMFFVGPSLWVMLATIHVSLSRVTHNLTEQGVADAIRLAHLGCRQLGVASPRIGVCGLNPHAGEGGLLGHEDQSVIKPAVQACRREGIDVSDPLPADTLFHHAVRSAPNSDPKFHAIVAMYHDQGLIPAKLLDQDRCVNMTVGLRHPNSTVDSPRWMVRTSPAHGTAFDIAGSGRANPGSMIAAIRLAERLISQTAGRGA